MVSPRLDGGPLFGKYWIMQKLIPFAACLVMALAPLHGMQVKTAYTRHYQAEEIRTVTQYFVTTLIGNRFRTIISSDPDNPTGQYFIIKLQDTPDSKPVNAHMILYKTDSKEPEEWTWALGDIRLDTWLYLGLTGADWPDEEIQPLAWRLEFLDASGAQVAWWNSFLWEREN